MINSFYLFLVVMMSLLTPREHLFSEISKENLFRTSSFISAKISPDGNTIAYVGGDEAGILNVFTTSRDNPLSQRNQISFFKTPEIIQFFWSAHSDKILLLKDENGTAQLNLHGIDIHSKEHRVYTEKFARVSAKVIKLSPEKNTAVIGLNHRNPHFHDLYLLDLNSGEFNLLLENDSYAKFLVSDSLEIILKMKINEDGSWTIYTKDDAVFMQLNAEDAFQTEFLSYDERKNAVYLLDNRFSNTNQLIERSLSNLEDKVLGADIDSDIDEVLWIDGKPRAYATYYTQKKWHVIDPSIENDISFLEDRIGTNFEIINQSKSGEIWIVSMSIPDKGTRYWIYERNTQQLSLLHPQITSDIIFSKMYPLVVDARDGKKLVCYYTLPTEYDKGGYVDTPIPLVVMPHGGPFKVRDKFEFNPYHQWLASCGYAVLSVNFRLSSGFGKEFVNAGNGQWGGKAHLDVIDAVEACIAKGITQKEKLAIFGGSYGGYESLASLTFSPKYYTCCVSICGPSNLKTVLDNVPQFWELTSKPLSDKTLFMTKRAFIRSMGGDPETQEGIDYLQKCSPLNHLEGIKVPLLLVHGKNDHIVAEGESRQIYESMKKNQKQATYILFPDEGHRFAKFPNKMVYLDHSERFLSQHLGGTYLPIEKDIAARSSATISN